MAAIVPELYVSSIERSLAFYCDRLGFAVRYERKDERFAYLERDGAELMIEEPQGRTWLLGPLDAPRGHGISLQISCRDAAGLYGSLADLQFVQMLERKRYLRQDHEIEQLQFVIADTDGYLLRFIEILDESSS